MLTIDNAVADCFLGDCVDDCYGFNAELLRDALKRNSSIIVFSELPDPSQINGRKDALASLNRLAYYSDNYPSVGFVVYTAFNAVSAQDVMRRGLFGFIRKNEDIERDIRVTNQYIKEYERRVKKGTSMRAFPYLKEQEKLSKERKKLD